MFGSTDGTRSIHVELLSTSQRLSAIRNFVHFRLFPPIPSSLWVFSTILCPVALWPLLGAPFLHALTKEGWEAKGALLALLPSSRTALLFLPFSRFVLIFRHHFFPPTTDEPLTSFLYFFSFFLARDDGCLLKLI